MDATAKWDKVVSELESMQKDYTPDEIDDLNLSSKIIYQYLTAPRDDDKVNEYGSDYIDVRDVADAFVAAVRVEEAGNERFILDAGMSLSSSNHSNRSY